MITLTPGTSQVAVEDPGPAAPAAPAVPQAHQAAAPARSGPPSPARLVALALLAVVVLLVAVLAAIYGVGPLTAARAQRTLLAQERLAIVDTKGETYGGASAPLPTQPPLPGALVGIVAIPAIGVQQAVVEGAGPAQTATAPGHVPGTAGLGQPGNAAIVGRRAGFGGPFRDLSHLVKGDRIVTATTEGQSLYKVVSVRTETVAEPAAPGVVVPATPATTAAAGAASPTFDSLYGPSPHDQLTLVTSASAGPLNTSRATVVVARMVGEPYEPTPQAALSPSNFGNQGDPGDWAVLVLCLLALGMVLAGAAYLYRRTSLRSAYLLTTAPLLALTIIAADAASKLLPAWM